MEIRVLSLAWSLRKDSLNRKLLRLAERKLFEKKINVISVDLSDYPMPIYNQDLESTEGLPKAASDLQEMFQNAHFVLTAVPEYNSSFPPLFKNTLDWISRSNQGKSALYALKGLWFALLSASPGLLGGSRSLSQVRRLLSNISCGVLPEQFTLSCAHLAFDAKEELKKKEDKIRLDQTIEAFHLFFKTYAPPPKMFS